MFERFTEHARRVIFFARYEASQLGHDEIDDTHILLGLLRESRAIFVRFFPTEEIGKIEELHHMVVAAAGPARTALSVSVDLPLTNTAKRLLALAAEEADALQHRYIGPEHLLLAVLRVKGSGQIVLSQLGIDFARAQQVLAGTMEPQVQSTFVIPPPYPGGLGSGRAGTSVARSHLAVFEFVCDATVVASVTPFVITPVPRVGEQIALKSKEGGDVYYRVEDLTYCYEQFPAAVAIAPHQLTKVLIRIRPA